MVSHLYLKEAGNASSVILIAMLVCVAVFFGRWIPITARFNRFLRWFDEVGFQYLLTQDVDTYLIKLDECGKMPGVDKFTLSGMPVRHEYHDSENYQSWLSGPDTGSTGQSEILYKLCFRVNRAKFIQGSSRAIRLLPFQQNNVGD